ncbi:MAG: N-6 DNA methylase [bacterium]|nr:N-6 DNA methylase [bacterium]
MSKNERKTEDIVRDHFKKYIESIIIEEQSSDTPKIKKLLSTASKNGLGRGSPEFIIQYKQNPDLLIIVECKADVTKHESKDHLQYKKYAVDGVLLYSSYLTKEYDVLSIAISGESERDLKVSHFLQLKGEKKGVEKFSNKLLTPDDYLQGYLKSPEKFRQDYDKLLSFSKDLNDKLHTLQIKEDLRALLISAILIALEDSAFKKAYKDYTDAKQLARFLIDTALNQFEKAKLENDKIENLKVVYQQITILDGLVDNIKNIRDLIKDIDENINDFIRTHEYFDVLGQLYIEFLRYANSDKGLGIVLTPPHITEFMAKLGEVNKDSVVYDSCTGTGGFLVSAMKLMIQDAKGDQEKIKQIKAKQLIGVENKSHIFALACSNMFIHQDGKTNILNGSCFDKDIVEKVKEKKPTVGLLNPPYKSDKKKDIEELEFIFNNLECLEQGGKTVAIVPMQAALSQTGKILELKQKLLEQHTLEAVLSMPEELFINSKVAVVSCIMVFTAKRPHPAGKKTFFGHFKDDGFVKRKNRGRVNVYGRWDSIRERWIRAYMNKEDFAGLSINRVVRPDEEWCAEAYMKTDYSVISDDIFIQEVKKYVAFKVQNL